MIFVLVTTLLVSLVIAFQDFRNRQIHWFLLPIFGIGLFFLNFSRIGLRATLYNFFENVLFLFLVFVFTYIYFIIKKRKFIKLVDNYIGLGDILFLVVIAIYFTPFIFVFFFIFSMLLTLLIFGAIHIFKNLEFSTIPLAGLIAIYMIPVITISFFNKFIDFQISNIIFNFIVDNNA